MAVLTAYTECPGSTPVLGVNVKEPTSAGRAFMAEIGLHYREEGEETMQRDQSLVFRARTRSRRPSTGSSTPRMRNSRAMSTIPLADALRYRYSMRSDLSRRTRQVLLLCALALSVIGMHHVPLSPHVTMSVDAHAAAMPEVEARSPVVAPTLEARPAGGSGTGMGHDLLHMCLAVLYSAGGFLFLAWVLSTVTGGAPSLKAGLRPWSRRVWRPPRPTGRSLLTFVCVLRT